MMRCSRILCFVNNFVKFDSRIYSNSKTYQQLIFQSFLSTSPVALCKLENEKQSQTAGDKDAPKTSILGSIMPNAEVPDAKQEKAEEEEKQKQRDASWRTMKYTFIAFGISFTVLGGYIFFELGKPPIGSDGKVIEDEFSHMPLVKQYLYRVIRELDYYKRMIREPSREKLLPDVLQYPYYQPPYTLVMELTDVLIHPDWTYMTGWRFKKRPGIDHFLESVNGMYEVVIYTAEQGMTVFPIIEALDPNNVISYKLVRDATHFVDGHHVKNLSKLNRDLSRVIVIDWNKDSVKFHPENLFMLGRWSGNDDDTTLIDLAAFLRTIATSDVEDVREVLKYYNQFPDPLGTFREKQKQLMEVQEAERRASQRDTPIVKKFAPTLINRKPI